MWKIVNFKNWEMYISEFCLVDYPFKKKSSKMRETVFLLTKQECDNDIGQQQQQQVGMFYYTPSQPYSKILLHCWSTNRTSSQELTVTLQGEPMRGK